MRGGLWVETPCAKLGGLDLSSQAFSRACGYSSTKVRSWEGPSGIGTGGSAGRGASWEADDAGVPVNTWPFLALAKGSRRSRLGT